MKILVVEPMKVPYEKEIPDDLDAMQAIVGGYIEVVSRFRDAVIVCNEEGKLMGLPYNRAIFDESGLIPCDIICGTFFLAGMGEEDFISLTDDQISKYKEMYSEQMVLSVPQEKPKKQKSQER